MKHTIEWVKEKCFEIMQTIFDGDIKPEQVKWDEEETVMKMLIKLPQKLIKNNGLFEVLKEKYGKDTYNNQCGDEQEVDVYINNVDFQIFIYEGELIVRLYYCLECNNCNQYEKCEGKTYSWDILYCGKPTCCDYEEKGEQKPNYEKFDTILKEINKDEYENREDKEELLRDYLEDYKKIRKLVEDYYDDIEMLRYKGDDTKDATYNYHRNIKSLFEDIKKVYDKENDLLAFYDDLHDEVKSAIRDIDKRLESIDEEVDKITGYVDNNR